MVFSVGALYSKDVKKVSGLFNCCWLGRLLTWQVGSMVSDIKKSLHFLLLVACNCYGYMEC